MAFLDNSGDIILDAVLTDTGRYRLSKGDGSFSIEKFALGDAEINYALYRNANHVNGAHPSGSAYYDLEILQLPVLEAFTNNVSSMQSKLMSFPKTNHLYLPIMKKNDGSGKETKVGSTVSTGLRAWTSSTPNYLVGVHLVASDEVTNVAFQGEGITGVMNGFSPAAGGAFIQIEQGLDSLDLSPKIAMDSSLLEKQWLVQIDNRLGYICNPAGTKQNWSFLDDDGVALYAFDSVTNPDMIQDITGDTESYKLPHTSVLKAGRGFRLRFKIGASLNLQTPGSTYWFDLLGSSFSASTTNFPASISDDRSSHANNLDTRTDDGELLYIDSIIRVTGETTGYRLDIPVRFVKCTTCSDTNP